MLCLLKHSPDPVANQASALARICPSGCDERAALDTAIAKYKLAKTLGEGFTP